MKNTLHQKEILEYHKKHRLEKDGKKRDRIKTILLLDQGWTQEKIAETLLLDEDTIGKYKKQFEEGGMKNLLKGRHTGYQGKLSEKEQRKLKAHVYNNSYYRASDIVQYVENEFNVQYTETGMVALLKSLGFSYKKTKHIPSKADRKKQEEFLKKYEQLKKTKSKQDPIYFLDGVHPQHNSVPSYCWILKGKEKEIKANTGRARININGALSIEKDYECIYREDDTINAQSTIELFKQIEKANPEAQKIYCILDNARYYYNKDVQKHLKQSKIETVFLPPYSPNLNLIERLWKIYYKKVRYNKYYEKFDTFKDASFAFFENLHQYKSELKSSITENFQLLGT